MTLKFNEGSHRYWLDGKPIPGVTTLIGDGLPKKALVYWAAKSVAEFVADNTEQVRESFEWMDRNQLVAMLKETPWSQRDKAAVKGTDVHAIAERLLADEEVDDVPEHLAGYVEACVSFLDTWRVKPLVVEKPVAHRSHWWAGKPDLIGELPDGRVVLFDWKTTASGIYPETALQLAAYSHAEFYAPDPDTETPLPAIDLCAAVHLRQDGYDVIPVKGDDEAYKLFRHVALVANHTKVIKEWVGDALTAPTIEAGAA